VSMESIQVVSSPTSKLDVNPNIIRGITLRKCLRHVRRVWWKSPLDLSADSRAALWQLAGPVSGFDMFFSHTWQTSGLAKCCALLLQSTWLWCLAVWLLTTVVMMVLYSQNLLPMMGRYSTPEPIGQNLLPLGPWLTVFSLPSCLLGIILAVYLPERIYASPTCFLDSVSINQSDQSLMMQGIYGLGGFLKASRELRILWSPPYFSRLWCIFELAAYRTANPTGKIMLAPVFVESAVAAYFFGNYGIALLFTDREAFPALSILGQVISIFLLVRYLRRSLGVKRKLISDLRSFRVEEAECRLQYDRDFVLNAITEWFGSKDAFTEYVRGDLGRDAMSGYTTGVIPIQYQLLLVLPDISLNLDTFVSLWMGNLPTEVLVSHFLGMVLGYSLCWRMVSFSLIASLCDLAPSLSSCKMLLVDVLIFLAGNSCITGGIFAAQAAYGRGVAWATSWFLAAGLLAVLFQGTLQKWCSRCTALLKDAK
ncbi:unnamed protein product, partial [Symbiodinium necroappetens]